MTVEKLIKRLSKFSPKAQVRLNDRNGYPCLFVLATQGDNENVWLECENDCDLGNELFVRFQMCGESIGETDFYSELLEMGITIDTVRKYMGDERAVHMEIYCKEHGLI